MVFYKSKVFAFLFILFFLSITPATAQPEDSIYHLPAGTRLWLKAESTINSKFSSADDTFIGTLSRPLIIRDRITLDVGTRIEGRIVKAKAAEGGGRNGILDIRFETMFFETGAKRDIRGGLVKDLETKGSGAFNTIAILGSAAAGSILGGIAGSGRGSLIGGGIGASAGTGVVMLRKGKNVGIKEDQEFEIELTSGVVLPVTDY